MNHYHQREIDSEKFVKEFNPLWMQFKSLIEKKFNHQIAPYIVNDTRKLIWKATQDPDKRLLIIRREIEYMQNERKPIFKRLLKFLHLTN